MARRVSIIVAMARNRVIGANNAIPWRLPGELALFKRITMGHHIIMGRSTWESIGRLLPGRTSVVISRNPAYTVAGALVAHSLDEALAVCGDDPEVFVIGGAQLYASALPQADRLYLTIVEAEVAGDTRMPGFDLSQWRLVSREPHAADERNPYPYTLHVYDRAP